MCATLSQYTLDMNMVFIRTASSKRSQKCKKIGKNQKRFFGPFWGRRCWLALSLFFFLNKIVGVFPFFYIFYSVKFGTFFFLTIW